MIRMSTQSVTIPKEAWVPAGPKTFGDRIRQIRIDLRMDAQTIAALCGVPKNSWLNWENGKRPRDLEEIARKISDATRADLMWLLTGQTTAVTHSQNLTFPQVSEFCLSPAA